VLSYRGAGVISLAVGAITMLAGITSGAPVTFGAGLQGSGA
jgi:hypothetical protein